MILRLIRHTRTVKSYRSRVRSARIVSVILLVLTICSAVRVNGFVQVPTSKTAIVKPAITPTASVSYGTSVYVYPRIVTGASLAPGTNLTIAVYINNVTNLDAWEFKVKVDTSVLKAVDADATPFWDTQQAQGKGSYIIRVNATLGTAFVYWVSYRQPNGVLPSLTTKVPFQLGIAKFQVLASTQDTNLHLVTSQEDPNFGTILLDTNLNYIGYVPTDGTFANMRVAWDVNWDLKVDITDLVIVARSFGATSGSPGWNPVADVNGDGRVDIADIALVAAHFGQQI